MLKIRFYDDGRNILSKKAKKFSEFDNIIDDLRKKYNDDEKSKQMEYD